MNLLTVKYIFLSLFCSMILQSCIRKEQTSTSQNWKQTLKQDLSVFGHRNWILIVDKAFPAQSAEGITTIDTNEDLLPVLNYTLVQIQSCTHVNPIVYTDKELSFITKNQIPEIETFRANLNKEIGNFNPQVLLHDSVFVKIDKASKLFRVIILKTNQVIPYSSVFIQLDCKYWNGDKEKHLRDAISEK
jgi:hypothetical protein